MISIVEFTNFVKEKSLKGSDILSSQFLSSLKAMSNEEIVAMAKQEGFEITVREVRKLRPYLEQFSFSWLFFGIPNDIAQEIERVLGRKRSRQLIAMFSK